VRFSEKTEGRGGEGGKSSSCTDLRYPGQQMPIDQEIFAYFDRCCLVMQMTHTFSLNINLDIYEANKNIFILSHVADAFGRTPSSVVCDWRLKEHTRSRTHTHTHTFSISLFI